MGAGMSDDYEGLTEEEYAIQYELDQIQDAKTDETIRNIQRL